MSEQLGLRLFSISFWVYVVAAVCYLVGLFQNQKNPAKLGRSFFLVALGLHTAALVVITVAIGRPPFLNLYEYMVSFLWAASVVYAATELFAKNTGLGAFCVPLITIFVYLAQKLPNAGIDESIMPALRSGWRIPHIASAIMAYGAFLIAFVVAILYLVRESVDAAKAAHKAHIPQVREPVLAGKPSQAGKVQHGGTLSPGGKRLQPMFWDGRLPSAAVLDQTIYRTVAFGFLMQTLLVIVGAIWAQVAWGRYWGWDPKETWSLITWLIYATYLHTRTSMGWRGRKSAWLAIFGFAATGFTLIGVSFLFHGLHSYAAK